MYIIPNVICVIIGISVFIHRAIVIKYNSDDLISIALITFIMGFLGWMVFVIALIIIIAGVPLYLIIKFCEKLKENNK